MANRLSLSRSQLSAFLKDFESIKQFEKLFGMTNEQVVSLEQMAIVAASAQATAQAALAEVSRIADALELLASAPARLIAGEPEDSSDARSGALVTDELADVDTDAPQDGDALIYSDGLWTNGAVAQVDIGGSVLTVSAGAADSGGTGYRMLRVAN